MSILNEDGSIADPFRNFVSLSRYSRWLPEENRRETWGETVDRYFSFMVDHLEKNFGYRPHRDLVAGLREAVREHRVFPSMRALMTAGPALERSNIAGYNCAFTPIEDIRSLWETLYILLNGTGVGFSVERQFVDKLPPVPAELNWHPGKTIHVGDSKEGWARAYEALLHSIWLDGVVPYYDLSAIRPAGSRLETFGGRASGPEPLDKLFRYTIDKLAQARGRKLRPIEVHDLVCTIASVVVVGGVRRSAMISFSDLDDQEMATAKSGEWWVDHPERRLANISAVYSDATTREQFDIEWANIQASGSGERGIFNESAAQRQIAKYGFRDSVITRGNPCLEILLKPYSFCNLSTIVARPEDTIEDLKHKILLATILGTWQSTLTDFPLLREEWRTNAEEERLLGVSITGVYGNSLLWDAYQEAYAGGRPAVLDALRREAREVNKIWADLLGIPISHAITTIKPEGTTSQLAAASSGIHPWHSEYYIRTVRNDSKDPLAQLMMDSGVPHEVDAMDGTNLVFSFPVRAPEGAVTRADLSAIDHLELWLDYQRHYCEHKPSVTVNIRPDEWDKVGEWVWEHLGEMTGVAFLPYAEHTYAQAPYQEVDEATYNQFVAENSAEVRWADLPFYELADSTTATQELACSAAGGCDL